MTLKILLASLLIAATTSSVLSSLEDHHGIPSRSHRIVWPVWYRDRLPHAKHDRLDDKRVVQETTTTTARSPWTSRPQISTTRSPRDQINLASRHMEQRMLEQKFNAVAIVENGGTRATAYAGYHGNHHQHQPREMGTQGFQPITTTIPTYTRHHSGWVNERNLRFGI